MRKRYLVVGGGAAGARAVETIRARDPAGETVLVTEERYLPYSRPLLADYISGRVGADRLALRPDGDWSKLGATVRLGSRAANVDADNRLVWLADGSSLSYDALLVATGAQPVLPPAWAGHPGVTGLRSLDEAERVRRAALSGGRIVIVGAGALGVKLACALREAGVSPLLLEVLPRILSGLADAEAAILAERRLAAMGITVRCGVSVAEVSGETGGMVLGLSDGTTVAADLVVACTGARPAVSVLDGQVRIGRGVAVDETMRTSREGIWAAGDVVEVPEVTTGEVRVSGIWPHATAQGRVAGLGMTGRKAAFRGSLRRNVVDVLGLPVISMGVVEPSAAPGWTAVSRRSRRGYLKLVLTGDVLAGAVIVGDPALAGRLQACLRKGETAAWPDVLKEF